MSRKSEENKFSDCQNVDRKSVRWLKMYSEITMSKEAEKLTPAALGFYVLVILKIIMQNFDVWNPGALKIQYKYFRNLLLPFFKHKQTIKKIREILDKLGLIYCWIEEGYIILYSPYVERHTKSYVKKKCSGIEAPARARDLLGRCKLHIEGEIL